ncbi:MAG: diacylglycerol/lipid kinase family protein [Lacibacter sp.]
MVQRHLLFLFNPKSGSQKNKRLYDEIHEACSRSGIRYEIQTSRADGNYHDTRRHILSNAITDVIIAGGDGTISTVTSALRDLPVVFGILPLGSGNGLALAAGISRNLRSALETILKGNHRFVDAFTINQQFSCMLSGLGFDAQVAHDFDRQTKRGFLKYVELTVKNLTRMRNYTFHIQAQEVQLKTNAYFISIANSNQFGNHFTIAPKAQLSDGLIDIVVVERSNFLFLLPKIIWHIRNGKLTENFKKTHGIIYFQTQRLTILNPDHAPLHIDGDGKPTADRLNIEIIPHAYRLIMP